MRISTRGRYALRAMVDLALHSTGTPISRQEVAVRQGISANYVAQLFRQLRQAQLVKAIKGPGGGYILARSPAAISAGDVLRAVEGPLAVAWCIMPENDQRCQRIETCAVRPLLERITQAIADVVDNVTLQDLCDLATTQNESIK